jgi:hypothetical protein
MEELRAPQEELRTLEEENLRLREQLRDRLSKGWEPKHLSLPGG